MDVLKKRVWSRNEIDGWDVATAGFNARVVNCMERAQVKTVGELRKWKEPDLMALRSFGIGCAKNIRWFFNWTKQMEAGTAGLPNFRLILREFLSRQQMFVIEHRYGLTDPLFRPQMRRKTLQEIANLQGGLTRERVRQVEEATLTILRNRLPRAITEPLVLSWVDQMNQRGGVITSTELGEWVNDQQLGGYQPWGVLVLISEVMPVIQFRHDYFSGLPVEALDRLEGKILHALRQAAAPVPLEEILAAAADEFVDRPAQCRRVVTILLAQHPEISGTLDQRYFLPRAGEQRMVADILGEYHGEALHYHELTRLYNERVQAQCRRGTGHILRVVNDMPQVQRISRALYALKTA